VSQKMHTKLKAKIQSNLRPLTDFQNYLSVRFSSKFALKRLLRIPPHLAYVVTPTGEVGLFGSINCHV